MAFKLRSQSPIEQRKSFSESLKDNKPIFDKSQKSLAKSNANIKKLDPTGEKRKAIYSRTSNSDRLCHTHEWQKDAVFIQQGRFKT